MKLVGACRLVMKENCTKQKVQIISIINVTSFNGLLNIT